MGEPNLIKETRGLESKKSDMMMNAEIEIEKCSTTDFEDGRKATFLAYYVLLFQER